MTKLISVSILPCGPIPITQWCFLVHFRFYHYEYQCVFCSRRTWSTRRFVFPAPRPSLARVPSLSSFIIKITYLFREKAEIRSKKLFIHLTLLNPPEVFCDTAILMRDGGWRDGIQVWSDLDGSSSTSWPCQSPHPFLIIRESWKIIIMKLREGGWQIRRIKTEWWSFKRNDALLNISFVFGQTHKLLISFVWNQTGIISLERKVWFHV